MRQVLIAAATAAALTLSIGAAQAFPIAPAASVQAGPEVTLVSGGCGPYRHRGPYGGCRPGGGGFIGRPFGYGGPRYFGHRRVYGGFHRRGY